MIIGGVLIGYSAIFFGGATLYLPKSTPLYEVLVQG